MARAMHFVLLFLVSFSSIVAAFDVDTLSSDYRKALAEAVTRSVKEGEPGPQLYDIQGVDEILKRAMSVVYKKEDMLVWAQEMAKAGAFGEELQNDGRQLDGLAEDIISAWVTPIGQVIGEVLADVLNRLPIADINVTLKKLTINLLSLELTCQNFYPNITVAMNTLNADIKVMGGKGTNKQDLKLNMGLKDAIMTIPEVNLKQGATASLGITATGTMKANIDASLQEISGSAVVRLKRLPADISLGTTKKVNMGASLAASAIPINLELGKIGTGVAPIAIVTVLLVIYCTLAWFCGWQLWQLHQIRGAIVSMADSQNGQFVGAGNMGPFCNVCGCRSDFSKDFCSECGSKIIKFEMSTA